MQRRHRELSKQQAMYIAKRETGASREQSAIFAGYPAGQEAGKQVESSELVQKELARARAQLAKKTGITREDIVEILLDAIRDAKTMADPQAMIRGASELAKLLGLNAPETKKVLHELGPGAAQAMKALSDEELHRIARGRVVEGEYTRVNDVQDVSEVRGGEEGDRVLPAPSGVQGLPDGDPEA